jgi:hypothetical protein
MQGEPAMSRVHKLLGAALQSLKIQGRSAEASSAPQQLDTAWKNADVTLVGSAY